MALSKKLAAALARDDARENAGMHGDDRSTCHRHQSWADDCDDQHAPLTAGRVLAEALEIDRIRQA